MSGQVKVRYYLEQSIADIQDLRKRKLFTSDELATVMKRRTEYEHRLLSRMRPIDFLMYAQYEMRFDRLRQLRVQRLHTKSGPADWAGPRRITFILRRGTRRFPGHLPLWTALIDYAAAHNDLKVLNKALTSMLSLHPADPNVWVYVAKHQAEKNAAIAEARAVLQRGLRFNPQSEYLWIEYIKLELIYVARILARREILGITTHEAEHKPLKHDGSLPISVSDMNIEGTESEVRNLPDINMDLLGDPESNPALRGDIALAVFDAGASTLSDPMAFVRATLEVLDSFDELDRQHLCAHVIQWARQHFPDCAEAELWTLTLPVRNVDISSPEYPDYLRLLFNIYQRGLGTHSLELKDMLRADLTDRISSNENADSALRQAVDVFLTRM